MKLIKKYLYKNILFILRCFFVCFCKVKFKNILLAITAS